MPAGTLPQDYPRHFDGLSPVLSLGFAPIPTVGRIEGTRAGFLGVGSCRPGPAHIEPVSAGHEPEEVAPVSSSTRASDRRRSLRHGTDQQFSHPVSSLTRASDARDARGRVHSRTLAMARGEPQK